MSVHTSFCWWCWCSSPKACSALKRERRFEGPVMRFMFKTDYEDDIRLFPHSGYVISYGILLALLLIAPFVLGSYIVSQLVFVCIYAPVAVGLMILTPFTGHPSFPHPPF